MDNNAKDTFLDIVPVVGMVCLCIAMLSLTVFIWCIILHPERYMKVLKVEKPHTVEAMEARQ